MVVVTVYYYDEVKIYPFLGEVTNKSFLRNFLNMRGGQYGSFRIQCLINIDKNLFSASNKIMLSIRHLCIDS